MAIQFYLTVKHTSGGKLIFEDAFFDTLEEAIDRVRQRGLDLITSHQFERFEVLAGSITVGSIRRIDSEQPTTWSA